MSEGSQTEQENIPVELFAESKLSVGGVKEVQEPNHPVALVELEVVKVVELRGGQEGEVVAGMSIDRPHQGQNVPDPGSEEVAAQQEWPEGDGQQVGENVLQGVSVQSGQAHRGCPLVVDLVERFVEQSAVQQDVGVVKPKLLHNDEDRKLQ